MIKTSQFSHLSVKAALYYVRLKTHNSSSLFALPGNASIEPAAAALGAPLVEIVADELLLAADRYSGIGLDQWSIVPDAIHALVSLQDERPSLDPKAAKPRLLTAFIAGFKAATATRINLMRNQPGSPVWQRSYKEQLVEDDMMLFRLRQRISDAESVVMSSQAALG